MGALIVVSVLFSGSISDNEIFVQSGFFFFLSFFSFSFVQKDCTETPQTGDAIMADKGFTTDKELEELGLGLNVPPLASSAAQMSVS